MPEQAAWERCRDSMREFGSGVVWVEAGQIAGALARQPKLPPLAEDEVRRSLDDHAIPLGRGAGFPLFLADGTGRYALLEAVPPERGRGLSEAAVRDLIVNCLTRLGAALRTDLRLLKVEFQVDGKAIDIAAETPQKALWALEVKLGPETGDGVVQVAGYVSLCRQRRLGYSTWFGAVLAPEFSEEAKTIARGLGVWLCQYHLCAEYTVLPPR